MNDVFTARQTEEIRAFKRGEFKRINLWDGSVRSGKTWITIVIWVLWVATLPQDAPLIMIGKSLTALKRNVLDVLVGIVGEKNFTYSTQAKEATLFGHKIYLEGANDARSEGKIRGITLMGAYCDELTLYPEDFFVMLLSRLSMPWAMLMATTNPDGPAHWLKVNYIDKATEQDEAKRVDMRVAHFLLDDNTTLPPDYIDNLKREYTGVFYERFIRGLWVAAQGAIYPMFDRKTHVVSALPAMRRTWVSVDYGHTNPTVFLHMGEGIDGRAYVIREWVHSRDKEGALSPKGYSERMRNFLSGTSPQHAAVTFDGIFVDPSAEGFIIQLREDTNLRIRGATNDVLPGISLVSSMLAANVLKVHESCKTCISEFSGYVWDEKAGMKGEDKPVKQNDHCLVGSTLVHTDQGRIPISELLGMTGQVECYDERARVKTTSRFFDVRITQKDAPVYKVELEDGRCVTATAEHPFLTTRGWVKLSELTEDDEIICIDVQVKCIKVRSIKPAGRADVYNMEVEGHHNFAVNGGVIVHNCMDAIRYGCMADQRYWKVRISNAERTMAPG